jgi:eukaryotic-like serine/threonine-protein kinase
VAVAAVLSGLLALRQWLAKEQPEKVEKPLAIAALQAQRTRENLINLVHTIWIDDYLKKSIHSEVVKLSLIYHSEAVTQRPWQMVLHQPDQKDILVPPEKSLLEIFTAAGRNLLILGEPGSGKTTTLLQLADALLNAAQLSPDDPVPIILNLSSWAQKKEPLVHWLVEEIFLQYGIARDLTRAGIANESFLYLLDGLDEVDADARQACITAINTFRKDNPAEMVICSRTREYQALQTKLHLGTVVEIQPLSDDKIDDYLNQEGLELQAVSATLAHDPDLLKLARIPLMLSLMTLAYRSLSYEQLQPLADKASRRRHLFEHYVSQMFNRRLLPPESPYSQKQAVNWLSNLAKGVSAHRQSDFFIERLQTTWLPSGRSHRMSRLIFGLVVGLTVGVLFGSLGSLLGSLIDQILFGVAYNVPMRIGHGLFLGLLVGLVIGPLASLFSDFGTGPIKLVEEIEWHPPSIRQLFQTFQTGLIGAFYGGILSGLLGVLFGWIFGSLLDGLRIGVATGVIAGLVAGLFNELGQFVSTREFTNRMHPNQGIRNSALNGLRMGLIYTLLFGSLAGVLVGLFSGLWVGLLGGLVAGLTSGIIAGLFRYGGDSVIRHYSLRIMLDRAKILPYPLSDRQLVAFLDAMNDRILLRRVGGGWTFIHRFIQDYFANL